jgi:cell wall-associated NlpC family hydrolase
LRFAGENAKAGIVALALGAALVAAPSAALAASGGGLTPIPAQGSTETAPPVACSPEAGGVQNSGPCPPVRKARLVEGAAIPPPTTPSAVLSAIAAANTIRTKPYIWGGGHARWWDRGYDCSGSVSFALHGGGLLQSPLDSGEMMRWGAPGKGRWITVYANAGHAFAVIDGLRWDTAGDANGTGPRWHKSMVSSAGYVARHPLGY